MTEEMRRAPATPCHECPWRVSNQDRPVPERYAGTLGREQRVREWAELRLRQHPRDCHLGLADRTRFPNSDDPEWIAMGYVSVPLDAQRRECAGAVAAAMRELRRLNEAGSWDEYRRRYPLGLLPAVAEWWARRTREGKVPGLPPLRPVKVDDAEIIDPAHTEDLDSLDLMAPEAQAVLMAMLKAMASGLAQRAGVVEQ